MIQIQYRPEDPTKTVLGGFLKIKYIFHNIQGYATYTVPDWTRQSLLVIGTTSHGGDVAHLYLGEVKIHGGDSLLITFSGGVITSTESSTQGLRITLINF